MAGFDSFSGIGKKIFGSKPDVPDFVPVNAQKEQGEAATGNLAVLPKAESIGSEVNRFNFDEIRKMLKAAIPSYDAMMQQGSADTLSFLKGEIPGDVKDAISQRSASRALYSGFGAGSGMGRNLEARDLGLTSLGVMEKGLDSASRWMQSAKALAVPSLFDVTAMFLSPQQQIAVASQNNEGKFQRDWMAAKVAAAPDPTARGIYDTVMTLVGAAAQVYSGGMTKPYNSQAVAGGTGGMFMEEKPAPFVNQKEIDDFRSRERNRANYGTGGY